MIHVRTWPGTNSARVTEMDGALKRGARLRVLRLPGWRPSEGDSGTVALNLRLFVEKMDRTLPFAVAEKLIQEEFRRLASGRNIPHGCVAPVRDREIRGVDAPKEPLVFSCPKWSIKVDEEGIILADATDKTNEPREITHGQSPARAYDIARRVWGRLIQAPTMSQAGDILTDAGARLHYYCAMD